MKKKILIILRILMLIIMLEIGMFFNSEVYAICDACNNNSHISCEGTHTYKYNSTSQHYVYCCDGTLIAPENHKYTSKTTTSTYLKSNATCTSAPVYYYKCYRKGCTAKGTATYTSGSELGHNYVQKYNDTQHYLECSRCGDTKNFVNHEWSGVSDSQHSCACGKMSSHTFTAATCTKDKKCSECDWIIQNTKLGHSYSSKVTKAATCTATGVKTYTCTRCSNSYTEEISALGHTPGTTIVGYKNIAGNIHVPEYECKNGCGLIITRWYY